MASDNAVSLATGTALITGAGSGVGLATARLLARQGMNVAIVGRRADKCDAAAAEITRAGGQALSCPADVGDAVAVAAMVSRVVERFGGVDVLVNNAGGGSRSRLLDSTDREIDAMLRAHVYGPIHCTRECYRVMAQRGRGHVVNVASVAAHWTHADEIIYGTAKAAMVKFTHHLRSEFDEADKQLADQGGETANRGFFTHVLMPGGIKTPFWEPLGIDCRDRQWLEPDDVAAVILAILQHPREGRPFFEKMFADQPAHVCSFREYGDLPHVMALAHRSQTRQWKLA